MSNRAASYFSPRGELDGVDTETSAVDNGAEAIDAVERGCYDLVLMDCQMPVMDGFEATRRIRQSEHSDIPIIALTASAMSGDREQCLREGKTDFLSKPVDLVSLAEMLDSRLPVTQPQSATSANGQRDEIPDLSRSSAASIVAMPLSAARAMSISCADAETEIAVP